MSLLIVRDVTKEYQRGKRTFKALDTVSLTLRAGELVSIFGKSGSGKSTLLHIMAGLTLPTSGSVIVEGYQHMAGKVLSSFSDQELSRYRNKKIGFVPQEQSALADLTVLDNVRLPFHLAPRPGHSTVRAYELLEQVRIEHLAESYPKHLSGGELKRVALARALMNDPDILIADEPTGSLDKQTTLVIMDLLQSVAEKGKAVLIVTHDPEAMDCSTRSFIMESGVLTEGTK
jgi:putative ABC transport system ATP-binding protein